MNTFKNLTTSFRLLILLLFAMPGAVMAQSSEEKLIEFFSDNATMEDDPKQGVYNITIYSPDGQWKMQLNYHSDSMFGTFGNADFRLDTNGKNYNYARNPKNDMVFYSFIDMNVSVAYEETLYRVKANCLTNNKTRFIVEATIAAPKPTSFKSDDLGYARITTNSFYGTYNVKAENERYKLEYGIVSEELLGTFYRADILMPELHDKQTGKDIPVINATAVHTQDGENTALKIDILSQDLVQYTMTMFNGPYEVKVKEERNVDIIKDVVLQDLRDMYGCYQFGGQNDEYAVAIALTPDAVESGRTEWVADDIFLPYTAIINRATNEMVDIFDINAWISREDEKNILNANVTSFDGILYHVRMFLQGGNTPPAAVDTLDIDFGHAAVVDYTMGIGTIGLGALVQDKYQIRCYLNTHELKGSFENEDFVMDMCDIMVVDEERGTYVFHDAKYATAEMEEIDGVTHIAINMIGVDDVLYRATMTLTDMQCMHDMELPISADDAILMVGMQQGTESDYAEYTIQFQDMENVYDEDYNIVGDGYVASFYFGHNGTAAIAGEYGYSAGTLAIDEYHTFYENGCEVRIAPVAGTLTIEPVNEVTVRFGREDIKTYAYRVKFQFVGQNSAIYSAEGDNYLLCLDQNEEWLSMDEPSYTGINEVLAEQGFRIRKVLKGGKVIIESLNKTYDASGIKH